MRGDVRDSRPAPGPLTQVSHETAVLLQPQDAEGAGLVAGRAAKSGRGT